MLEHEQLFNRLQDVAAVNALIGTTETLFLDCKIWPQKDDDAQRMLAKALCGFANAEGGVIVIGLEAKGGPNRDDPDVIRQTQPVADAVAVKSKIENLIGQLVEPPLEGVQLASVPETLGSKPGFVLVEVPPTEGFPCRSRKDWKFYQRISAGTFPMEYFQIADLFGKRRRPVLKLYVEDGRIAPSGPAYADRMFIIGIENCGRGVAKFPSLRFKRTGDISVDAYGIDGNGGFGLPQRPTESEWIVFGGGVDHVIYPGSTLKVANLKQRGKRTNGDTLFEQYTLTAELVADECPSTSDSKTIPEKNSRGPKVYIFIASVRPKATWS